MKTQFAILALITILFSLSVKAGDFIAEKPLSFDKVFVPQGYDNNDSIDIVASGYFSSTCEGFGNYSSTVDVAEKIIQVEATYYQYEGKCLSARFGFSQVIHLGLISTPGTYTIVDKTSGTNLGRLEITAAIKSEHGTDEALYAPVDDAFLFSKKGQLTLRLVGILPGENFEMEMVKTISQLDTMVVLPLLRNRRDGHEVVKPTPFFYDVPLSEVPAKLPFLLHVRTLSGQSLNKVITSITNLN